MSQRVLNINFHGIGTPPDRISEAERAVWVPRSCLAEILDRATREPEIGLSFDDGNSSDVEVAVPMLLERGLTAAFFIVSDRLGEAGYVSPGDVAAIARAGMAVGSHGATHRPWRALDEAELGRELTRSRATLEDHAGAAVTSAACPFGVYDRRVLRAVRGAGYERIFTSDGGVAQADQWLQPRTSLRAWDDGALIDQVRATGGLAGAALRGKRMVKAWR
jgi:peptidoglycan/xylan/chitin deacetylase (PgdA/CDA1 family)